MGRLRHHDLAAKISNHLSNTIILCRHNNLIGPFYQLGATPDMPDHRLAI